jgi:hypothetical protein
MIMLMIKLGQDKLWKRLLLFNSRVAISRLLSKTLICLCLKVTILSIVSYKCETWSLTLWEEVPGNKVTR